jgi:hypothetical protein
MIIPTQMLDGNQLDLWAECFETRAAMVAIHPRETVTWMNWDIEGDAGDEIEIEF